jgi:hypothetical protein
MFGKGTQAGSCRDVAVKYPEIVSRLMMGYEMKPLEVDVLVAGGGTAGSAAAVAAARRGHRVLLVEEANALGGTSTSGGVGEWFASQEGLGDIFDEVRRELGCYGATAGRHFDPEPLKIIWQLLAQQAGVQLLLHTTTLAAETAEQRVRQVRLAGCSRELTVGARYFIDATGEGDLGALCGAGFEQGDPEQGRTLHMTLTFALCDSGRPVTPYLPAGLPPINDDSELPGLTARAHLPGGLIYCNMTKVMGHDPTDPFSLSAAECEARRQVARLVHYLQRTHYPTYTLAASGARIGIREGRRLTGDYVLGEADITGPLPRDFPDGVAVGTAQIDFHSLTQPGNAGWRERVEPYAIPWRCLRARGYANLLMAGKCASADQVVQSSLRMTPTCCAMGQAVGTGVALALENGLADIREVEVTELRAELTAAGLELDPARHTAFAPSLTEGRQHRL